MNEENIKNYITEEHLDKRLEEQTQVIIEAVDSILDKRLKETQDELSKEMYIVRDELNQKIDGTKVELKTDINNVQILIDGYVKAQEDFKQEFIIMKDGFK